MAEAKTTKKMKTQGRKNYNNSEDEDESEDADGDTEYIRSTNDSKTPICKCEHSRLYGSQVNYRQIFCFRYF